MMLVISLLLPGGNIFAGKEDVEAAQSDEKALIDTYLQSGQDYASFDGQDLSTSPVFSYTSKDLQQLPKTLTVVANFPTTGVSDAKVEIKFNNILQLENAPGMVPDSANGWKFDASTLATQLQGVIRNATYVPEIVNGVLTGKGTLVYEFAPGTTSVVLDIQLSISPTYALGVYNPGVDETRTDVVGIRSLCTEGGAEKEINSVEVDSVTLLKDTSTWVGAFEYGTQYKYAGDSGTIGVGMLPYIYSDGLGTHKATASELKYHFKVNNKIGITNVRTDSGTVSYAITPDLSDPDYDSVEIVVANFAGPFNLYFDYQLQSDIPVGSYNVFKQANAGAIHQVTRIDNTVVSGTSITSFGYPSIIEVGDPDAQHTLAIDAGNQTLSFQDLDASMNYLGNMNVANKDASELTNQSAHLDFSADNGVYGVEHINLAVPPGVEVKNISAKTNLGNTFTAATLPAIANGSNQYVNITKSALGITNEDEYISEVTWDYDGTFTPAWGTTGIDLAEFTRSAVQYYGKILSLPADRKYSAALTISETDNPAATSETKVQTITVPTGTVNATLSLATNLNTTQKSGSQFTARVVANLTEYNYSNLMARKLEGIVFYVRDTEYATVDPTSFKVTWGEHEYSASDGTLTIIEGTDNTNNKVYRLELPEIILGSGNPDDPRVNFPNPTLDYKFKIKPTAPTTSVSGQDFVSMAPLDSSIPAVAAGYYTNFLTKDKFNVTGQNDPNLYLAAETSATKFNIQAQKDFTVTTAANLNDGPWVSYDYDTNQSIINLNPSGEAKYQLSVANNSGQTIDGYTALIPIPKYGEKTDLTPATPAEFDPSVHLQKEAFTWTTSITDEIVPSGSVDYEVLYATTYATDKDSAAFVPWDEINDKDDIRMIKISTTDSLEDGDSDKITFPLAISDPDAEAHAGNTNIYSARIFRSIDGTAGYKPSESIAIRLKTGVVKGQVFYDKNRNGFQDTGETGRNGVSVVAYEAGTTNVLGTTTTKTINDVDGQYEFLGLDKRQPVDIVFKNPALDDSVRFSPMAIGGSTVTESIDHKTASVSSAVPSVASSLKIDAGLMTPVKITMDAHSTTTVNTDVLVYTGEAIATEPTATKTGYTFNGWFTEGTGGSKVAFPYTVGSEDRTLHAQYTPNNYVMTFNNEGTTSTQTTAFESLVSKPADPVKTGYTFTGWYDAPTGGTKWDFTTDKMPASDKTLYAQFTVNNYTMTFDNGGTTSTQSVVFDTLASAPIDPIKTGYTFKGWYDAPTGGTKWDFVTNKMPAADKTLYAQYSVNNYTMTFDNQGTTSTQSVVFDTLVSAPVDPVKTGYTFKGWYDEATGGDKWDFANDKMLAADETLYAQFNANKHTLTFDKNTTDAGSTDANETSRVVTYDEEIGTLPIVNPTRPGYTFVEWNTKADGTGMEITASDVVKGDMTAYAKWKVNGYTVTFDKNTTDADSTDANETSRDVTYNEAIGTLPTVNPTRPGYTFAGWNTKADGTGAAVTATDIVKDDVTAYAKWEINNYTVTFDKNTTDAGSTDANETSRVVTYNEEIGALPAVNPTRPGYTFVEWNTKADGTGTKVTASDVVKGDVTAYAKWKANSYTVIFDKNTTDVGSTDANETSRVVFYNEEIGALPTVSPTRPGYTFVEWNTKADGTGTKVTASDVVKGDITAYAKWEINNYTVTFDKNTTDAGSTDANETSRVVTYNEEIGALPAVNPTRPDYTFAEWNTKADGTGTKVTASDVVKGDVTAYAKWKVTKKIKITEKYVDQAGNAIEGLADTAVTVNEDNLAGYSKNKADLPTMTDYTYVGYKLAGETQDTALHTEDPITISGPLSEDTTITFVYGQDKNNNGKEDVTITEKNVEIKKTKALEFVLINENEVFIDKGDEYRKIAPELVDFEYQGYTIDGVTLNTEKEVVIPNIQKEMTVGFSYLSTKDVTPPTAPTINPIDPDDTMITGTGEPGGTIEVTLPGGEVVTGIVNPDGTWEITLPTPLHPEETITAGVIDPSGNEGPTTTAIVGPGVTVPKPTGGSNSITPKPQVNNLNSSKVPKTSDEGKVPLAAGLGISALLALVIFRRTARK